MKIKDVIDGLSRAHLVGPSGSWVQLMGYSGAGHYGGRAGMGDHVDIAARVLPDGNLEVVSLLKEDVVELSRIPPPWRIFPCIGGGQ